jgi:hypothetical protein
VVSDGARGVKDWGLKINGYDVTDSITLLKDSLAKYRLLTNHDSLSTLDEKSYNSLDDKPTIPTVTPAALTKVDDTNVTLTLGGTPATSLLQGVSITAGWTGILGSARGGTGNGFTKFTGPTTSEKTFTLPDANATIARTDAGQTFVGNQTITGNILPSADVTHDLGATSYRWSHIYGNAGTFNFLNSSYYEFPRSTEPLASAGKGQLYMLSSNDKLYFMKPDGTKLNISDIVSFPGFGTNDSTAAYGDHLHTGTYDNYVHWMIGYVLPNGGGGTEWLDSGEVWKLKANYPLSMTFGGTGTSGNPFLTTIGLQNSNTDAVTQISASGDVTWTSDTEIPTSKAVSDLIQVQYVKVSLDNATIKALYETPYTLIAAPGAGKAIVIDYSQSIVRVNYVTSALTTATFLLFNSLSADCIAQFYITDTWTTSYTVHMGAPCGGSNYVENTAVFLWPGNDITTGGGSIDLYIAYRIITL